MTQSRSVGATRSGVLGQTTPTAAQLTDLYSVPDGRRAKCQIVASDHGAVASTYRIALSPGGLPVDNSHYASYDEPLEANASRVSIEFYLGPGDVIRVQSSSGNVAFIVLGDESVWR